MPSYALDAALDHLATADPRMGAWIELYGPCELDVREPRSLFAAVLRSIVYQQLAGRAAAAIHARVLTLFPEGDATADAAMAISDEAFRAAGLSRAKLAAIRDLAERAPDLPRPEALARMQPDDVRAALTVVRGVGPWTADMLSIFSLGHPDVLPTGDLGVRKGAAALYALDALPEAAALTALAAPWRPFRSVASWYLWRAADADEAVLSRARAVPAADR